MADHELIGSSDVRAGVAGMAAAAARARARLGEELGRRQLAQTTGVVLGLAGMASAASRARARVGEERERQAAAEAAEAAQLLPPPTFGGALGGSGGGCPSGSAAEADPQPLAASWGQQGQPLRLCPVHKDSRAARALVRGLPRALRQESPGGPLRAQGAATRGGLCAPRAEGARPRGARAREGGGVLEEVAGGRADLAAGRRRGAGRPQGPGGGPGEGRPGAPRGGGRPAGRGGAVRAPRRGCAPGRRVRPRHHHVARLAGEAPGGRQRHGGAQRLRRAAAGSCPAPGVRAVWRHGGAAAGHAGGGLRGAPRLRGADGGAGGGPAARQSPGRRAPATGMRAARSAGRHGLPGGIRPQGQRWERPRRRRGRRAPRRAEGARAGARGPVGPRGRLVPEARRDQNDPEDLSGQSRAHCRGGSGLGLVATPQRRPFAKSFAWADVSFSDDSCAEEDEGPAPPLRDDSYREGPLASLEDSRGGLNAKLRDAVGVDGSLPLDFDFLTGRSPSRPSQGPEACGSGGDAATPPRSAWRPNLHAPEGEVEFRGADGGVKREKEDGCKDESRIEQAFGLARIVMSLTWRASISLRELVYVST
ncbi:unnamed protein product [Prorocentrum cordatum]|uniref:Uncharacterized protein n=1 Tax=Prorocentrum cordatum TaxID=2364126 RepID=A0ABN9TH10_9DINO|nr:unnamed protein product [Polarella glacialis]